MLSDLFDFVYPSSYKHTYTEPDGSKYTVWKTKAGEYHNSSEPAKVVEKNKITEHYWYENGQLHRDDDLPAVIKWNGTTKILEKWYYRGKRHRNGIEPAEIEYGNDGHVINEIRYYNDCATLHSLSNWQPSNENEFNRYIDDHIIKENATTYKWPEKTGTIEYVIRKGWFNNGKLHRKNGPALIHRLRNSDNPYGWVEWYWNGKKYDTKNNYIKASGSHRYLTDFNLWLFKTGMQWRIIYYGTKWSFLSFMGRRRPKQVTIRKLPMIFLGIALSINLLLDIHNKGHVAIDKYSDAIKVQNLPPQISLTTMEYYESHFEKISDQSDASIIRNEFHNPSDNLKSTINSNSRKLPIYPE